MLEATRHQICAKLARLALTSSLRWTTQGDQQRSNSVLRSNTGERLTLTITVMVSTPGRFTMLIRDDHAGDNNAVRLDARATHWNRYTDGRRWDGQTHLHVFTAGLGLKHAVDPPPPWPPAGWSESSPTAWDADELERAFVSFCGITGLAWVLPGGNTAWTPPNLAASAMTTEDGEEIP